MHRSHLFVGPVALAVAVVALAIGHTGPGDAAPAGKREILVEEFNGSRLDRSIWSTCHFWLKRGCTIASNNELEAYVPGQARVRRGRLKLTASRRSTRGQDGRRFRFVSGMISSGPYPGSSRAKFAFRYGRAEIRARIPRGRGLWPAFWLLPADRDSRPEIDVMEFYGHDPARLGMHLHWVDRKGRKRDRGKAFRDPRLASGWHTYAIDWRPGRLIWLIDGVERWRVTGLAVPRERMYLIANLAVGGDRPGAPTAATRFPSSLVIDHVKVWR